MEKRNSIIRVITFPLMIIVLLAPAIVVWLTWCKNWLLNGGEIFHYRNDETKRMADIYQMLSEMKENQEKIK